MLGIASLIMGFYEGILDRSVSGGSPKCLGWRSMCPSAIYHPKSGARAIMGLRRGAAARADSESDREPVMLVIGLVAVKKVKDLDQQAP